MVEVLLVVAPLHSPFMFNDSMLFARSWFVLDKLFASHSDPPVEEDDELQASWQPFKMIESSLGNVESFMECSADSDGTL